VKICHAIADLIDERGRYMLDVTDLKTVVLDVGGLN